MSNRPNGGAGRFTTLFTSIAAGDVHVAGLPAGSAGAASMPNRILPMSSGSFNVGDDTMRLIEALLVPRVSRLVPIADTNAWRPTALAAE